MAFTWNIVARNIQPDGPMRKALRQKLGRLEKRLKGFPPDKVHLQIVLEQHQEKRLPYSAMLALQMPSNIIRGEASAPDLLAAFDKALQSLAGKLETRKAAPRRETRLERQPARRQPREAEPAGFAAEPMAEGTGPQKLEEVIRAFFKQHYGDLLQHARRHIRDAELTGDIPAGALDARAVVDQVARQAESGADRKPEQMSWLVWLFHLLHEELHRRFGEFKQREALEVPTEKTVTLPELTEKAMLPLERIVQDEMETQVVRVEDVVSNPEAVPPDRLAAVNDLLQQLQPALKTWPRAERQAFEYYFLQGFEPSEVAAITGRPLQEVRKNIAAARRRLQKELAREEAPATERR